MKTMSIISTLDDAWQRPTTSWSHPPSSLPIYQITSLSHLLSGILVVLLLTVSTWSLVMLRLLGLKAFHQIALKLAAANLSLFLTVYLNISQQQGCFPSLIFAAHKRGLYHDTGNSQPIDHTFLISKLCEAIIRGTFNTRMLENNLFLPAQHWFQKSRSCATCQLDVKIMLFIWIFPKHLI